MVELKDLIENDRLVAFRQAWEEARTAGNVPVRRDITLRAFSKFIPDMLVLEKNGPRDYRYCQAGEGVKDRLEMHDAGANFFDFLHSDILDISEDWWGGLLAAPCGGLVSYSIEYPAGVLRHAATLLLPVAREDGNNSMLLGLTEVLRERYLSPGKGRTVVGEFWAEACHLDVGYGLPDSGPADYSHKPDADFLDRMR
ncbi:PAS domain-containing protein [Kordiimonas lipolytica]|uniref:PAS domain-containing protein n=1 Tax=Kordiimonas lipolytica TaxID=1662421 RepID=A0ABV8UBA0_9PROT|nr:PAS domain-containing protein [Kordiimonas lipolytica]